METAPRHHALHPAGPGAERAATAGTDDDGVSRRRLK